MTRALITGISGMVGSHLTDFLLKHTDWDIFGMIRWRSQLDNIEHLMDRVNQADKLFLLYGELRDSISINNLVAEAQPDYVFHLAAQSFPKASFSSPLDTFDTNIQGTVRLLEAIRLHESLDPVIHVCASSEVFGRVPREHLPINEHVPFHPASPYAISKVGTDLLGRFYAEAYGLKTITTRMFTHTGPRRGDVFAESSFAKQIAMIEKGLIPPILYCGNLNSMRTFADVRDAVRAYYMLVTVNPIAGEFYNIGGEYSCTVGELLDQLLALSPMGKKIEIKQQESRLRPIDADLQIPDTAKFSEHTGWRPEIEITETMEDLLEYWRSRIALGRLPMNR